MWQVSKWREQSKELKGKPIILIKMEGEPQMPEGLIGTINHVDDGGTIHVSWENGSNLGLIQDKDEFLTEEKEIRKYKLNKLKNVEIKK